MKLRFSCFIVPLKLEQAVVSAAIVLPLSLPLSAQAQPQPLVQPILPRTPDQTVECEILVIGGGLAGTAAAYEALLAGRTVCLTEITDWLGGQVSSQGTSALDEAKRMRQERFFPRGYNELRRHLYNKYGSLSSGSCWVSVSCFLPSDGHEILQGMLQQAAHQGKGQLKWFPNTVIKDLEYTPDGKQITSAIAIQHRAAPGTPPSIPNHSPKSSQMPTATITLRVSPNKSSISTPSKLQTPNFKLPLPGTSSKPPKPGRSLPWPICPIAWD